MKEKGANKVKNKKGLFITAISVVVLSIMIISFVISKGNLTTAVSSVGAFMTNMFNGETEAKRSISMESNENYENKVPGSWHLDKSAEWTAIDKAKITFDVSSVMKTQNGNYKDVILVLDISESMANDKLTKVQFDSIELVDYLLNDLNNRVALIVYNSAAETITDFTNNKTELINKINSITASRSTNYNDPLKHVNSIMENYIKEENRDVVTLFLTDGFPNVDTPNQVGTYEMLKTKYTYMAINGIQYEMGEQMTQELVEISDEQWVADMETLENVLFETAIDPVKYETFEVQDVINSEYFALETVEDIAVTNGRVDLTEEDGKQKITWNLNNTITGAKSKMTINLTLKDQYVKQEGNYPTNKGTKVTYKETNNTQTKETTDTPILRMQEYSVIYDANTPQGMIVKGVPETEKYYPFDTVAKKQQEPTCEGWNFKRWEMITENITNINEDTFIMPAENVTIRAIWGKPSISKSTKGTAISMAKPEIQIGDTVYYSPNGKYEWESSYAARYKNNSFPNLTLDSSEEGSFRITKWKVLSVDEETGNIEIVPSSSNGSERKVPLFFAQGYNNAVYLLNEACNKLYSDTNKGIIARSIAEEDFIKAGKKEYSTDTDKSNNWTRSRNDYVGSAAKYGYSSRFSYDSLVYSTDRYYPSIYGQENNYKIDGKKNGTGYSRSEQSSLIERDYKEGYVQANTSIEPIQTHYSIRIEEDVETGKVDVLLPNGSSTSYWIATRSVDKKPNYCDFNIGHVKNGLFGGTTVAASYLFSAGNIIPTNSIFPVVSLNSVLLDETEELDSSGRPILEVIE